ncbi:hypothetical protein, partial [Klebsiella pneumoniae]|uniref:hypothetical protein n=1 Tax=Klebsiella pneumoniae TaxID=573 RepID=UPI0024E07380
LFRQFNARRTELERSLAQHDSDNQQQRQQYVLAKEGVAQLIRLLPRVNLLLDDTLADRCDEIREQVEEAQEAARVLHQHGAKLTKLESLIGVLQSDPEQHEQLQADYQQAQQQQRVARQQAFALTEVV